MAIKKNAAKANIGPKKQVKATFAECTAEDPLKCRYHGPKMLQAELDKLMGKGAAKVKKTKNGYEITSDDAYDAYEKVSALLPNAKGSLGFKKAVFILGDGGFVTPKGEAELEDADTLSSTDAPEKKNKENEKDPYKDPFEELENLDIDSLADELEADLLDNYNELESVAEEAAEDLEAELLGNTEFDDDVFADATEEVSAKPETSKPKELTDDDIVETFQPIWDAEEGTDLADDENMKGFYKYVLEHHENPPDNDARPELWKSQLDWFAKASQKAHAAGVNNYALELLDKMLSAKGVLPKETNGNGSAMGKRQVAWNTLMDMAINGKKLMGTQYWAENIQPIIEEYKDAIANNNLTQVQNAVKDLQAAINNAPESGSPPSMESLKDEMSKIIAHMHDTGLNLTWDEKKGMGIGKKFEDAVNANNVEEAAKALQEFKDYISFLESGGDMPDDMEEELTTEDIKDFFKKCGFTEGIMLLEDNLAATKEALETGKWNGKPLTKGNKKWYEQLAKKAPDHKVANAINEMLSADKMKPKKIKKGSAKEMLSAALGGSSEPMVAEGMLKPLEHDESKFPQNLTKDELKEAIKKGKSLGGHGGLGTRLIEIDGKQYVCKAASGTGASVIRNGYNADMAYRAGGVYAPDAKLYEFGDGKTYKLSEFIPGKRLIDVWKDADETTRNGIRKDLLKGYPLDVLFSNYDVLGTSPEDTVTVMIQGADGKPQKTHVAFNNIMIGDDGHAYRVDNDGAFAMTGTGSTKHSGGGGYTTKVEAEKWDNWEDRQWIDDFRTLRRNEKNLGIFDRYSTADIFLSAGNINLDSVVGTLPKGIQKGLEKPLFEMKQMTWRSLNLSLGGYKNDAFVSMALDASYEASKRGLRELCKKEISWDDAGFGTYKKSWTNYQMQEFGEKPPEKPQDPAKKLKEKLANDEYTGSKIIGILLDAVKTINHHGGVKQLDSEGKPLGNGSAMPNPDYNPNPGKIAAFEKIDREKLEELAKTDENAQKCLGIYDTIMYSKENGWKKPIGQIPTDLVISAKLPEGFQSPTEKKILSDMEGSMAEYAKALKKYEEVLLPEYEARKTAHMKAEEAKARKSGGSIFHNFNHFADVLITEGVSTDGVSHMVKTAGVKPIEDSMSAQKGDSYNTNAVKWKIREMMALGYSAKQIRDMVENRDLYSGESYSKILDKAKDGTTEEWGRDMASQAMYCGLQMLKKENEINDQIDKASGIVFLNRNIGTVPKGLSEKEEELYKDHDKSGWVNAHLDSAADCMQFESNSWHQPYKQVYAVPFSRLVCCANDQKANGGDFGYDSEHEWVGNLLYLPCFVYHDSQGHTWKGAIDAAQKTSGMKAFLKKFADRLGMFSTHK